MNKETEIMKSFETMDTNAEVAFLREKYDFSNGFMPREGTIPSSMDCAKALFITSHHENACQWTISDAASMLEAMGDDHIVNQLCADMGKSYSTVSAWIRTGRMVPREKRHLARFTTFNEICTAYFSDDPKIQSDKVLELQDRAIAEKWNSQEARLHVKQEKGKVEPTDHKLRYLQIIEGVPFLVRQEPEYQEGELTIDLSLHKYLAIEYGVSIDWVDIPKM